MYTALFQYSARLRLHTLTENIPECQGEVHKLFCQHGLASEMQHRAYQVDWLQKPS